MLAFLIALAVQTPGEVLRVVSATPDRSEVRAGETVTLKVAISIAPGWHIYSTAADPKTVPTEFKVGDGFVLTGTVTEPAAKKNAERGYGYHEGDAAFSVPIRIPAGTAVGPLKIRGHVRFQACNDNQCLLPSEIPLETGLTVIPGQGAATPTPSPTPAPSARPDKGAVDAAGDELKAKGLGWLLGIAVLGGLISLVMPCVYPLIPITLTYFVKQAGSSRGNGVLLSSAYAIGIIVTFTGLGFLLTLLLGGAGARKFAADPWVNVIIAAIFFGFALSLLGLFELKLPAFVTGSLGAGSPRSGVFGAFVLGLLFSIVSFTCTIPIAASILGIAANAEHRLAGLLAMLVYSATMAVPFFLLGFFPSLIREVPKSGGWLHTVKVAAGFLELALAFAYIWKADNVWGWGLFDRWTVLAIWAAVAFTTSFYLLGFFRMKDDGAAGEIGPVRAMNGVLMMTLGFILVGGFLKLPVGFFNAVLPPDMTQTTTPAGGGGHGSLKVYDVLEEAEREARRTGKPLFIEFTGIT